MKHLIIFIFSICCYADAGFIKGNGGNSLVCTKGNLLQVQLLDFFEATVSDGQAFSFEMIKQIPKDKLSQEIISRISEVNAAKSQLYHHWWGLFSKEAKFIKDAKFETIDDSYHFIIPSNCQVLQTAIQREPLLNEPRYLINLELWEKMEHMDQVGLVFHELIYRDLKTSDSRPVRQINALLFSDQFKNWPKKTRNQLLTELGFK